jgi:hypothetical protein
MNITLCNRCRKEVEPHDVDRVRTSHDGVTRDYCKNCYSEFSKMITLFETGDSK